MRVCRWLPILILGLFVLFPPDAGAQEPTLSAAPICELPISTCNLGPIEITPRDTSLAPAILKDDCPAGYACVCIPSCPACKDCNAQVCVRDPGRECKTACDCEPGLGCFDGQCLAGFAPVFCCDSDICPAGQQCQDTDGAMGLCPRPDPMCQERVEKAAKAIGYLVRVGALCRGDADCVHIDTSTGCGGTCGAWVNKWRAELIGKKIDEIDAHVCKGFVENGCPYATPGCQATRGRCIQNRCQGVPVLPSPPRPRPIDQIDLGGSGLQELERQP